MVAGKIGRWVGWMGREMDQTRTARTGHTHTYTNTHEHTASSLRAHGSQGLSLLHSAGRPPPQPRVSDMYKAICNTSRARESKHRLMKKENKKGRRRTATVPHE
jgi:hypothetical protein